MKIAFHQPHLSERGTSVALWDYAFYNEKILGNQSLILYQGNNPHTHPKMEAWFQRTFQCIMYSKMEEIDPILLKEKVDAIYHIKYGIRDPDLSKVVPNLIHAVFVIEPHGERYATISKHLADAFSYPYYVPHMVSLKPVQTDLRQKLGIPDTAVVFGRHGGRDTFNIQYAKQAIAQILTERNDYYFLFLNTNPFLYHSHIIYLDCQVDPTLKAAFIGACDLMIHARIEGESFGLAVAEFSVCNKPILTSRSPQREYNCHLEILGDKAILYTDYASLLEKMRNIRALISAHSDWNCYQDYTPEKVIHKFKEIFLDNLPTHLTPHT